MTEELAARLLPLLPIGLQNEIGRQVKAHAGLYSGLSEIRLRAGRCASLTAHAENIPLSYYATAEELAALLTVLCRGSLYAYREPLREGYLPLFGGIRLGIAGRAVYDGGRVAGVSDVSSLVFRLPHPILGAGEGAAALFRSLGGQGLLIFSPPGVGKTTLLRDLAVRLSTGKAAMRTVLVDSRGELSSGEYGRGALLDILLAYPKEVGIEQAVRTLSPEVILVDEIGSRREAEAILAVAGGGVPLVATLHARSPEEVAQRAAIRPLLRAGVFGALYGLARTSGGVVGERYEIPL